MPNLRPSFTNAANSQNYRQTYAYDAIGNIQNKSDIGNYAYDGNQGSNYANPHAATTIGSSTNIYDNNGNLSSDGQWTHTWDYRNRLIQSTKGTTSVRYAYDQDDNRISYFDGTATTTFANKYYSIVGASSTKNVYAGDQLIATIETVGTTSKTYFVHPDHLGGSNVITDSNGDIVENIDYYPFGGVRLDNKVGSFDERRKFTGHEYDAETGLNYMVARYQDGRMGRFISQDPMYLEIGANNFADRWNKNWRDIKPVDSNYNSKFNSFSGSDSENRMALQEYLSNPQGLNSYSYVTNNPLKYTDPTGEREYHFSFNTNFGIGGEGGNSWNVGYATDGTFGVSTSLHGGGLAGVDASIGGSIGYSNAETWSDTLGASNYVNIGGKALVGGGVTFNFSNGNYDGMDVGAGIGVRGLPPVPVTFSGGVNKTVPVVKGNVKDVVKTVKTGYNVVKNTVTKSTNAVKQTTSKVYNYVKSKF